MDPDEEYRHDSEEDYDSEGADYGAEEYSQFSLDEIQEDEALERQAVVNEHVVPAQYQVKKELLVDKKKHFYLRVANLPEHFELEDFHKFFQKQVPHFKHSKMMPLVLKHDKSFLPGNVLIQTSDINTIDKLLGLHGRKFNGYPLSCWLMGFDHVDTDEYNLEFDPFFYEEQFQKSKKQEAKKSKENPESVKTDAKQVVTQDEEFEVKKIVRG